MWCVKFGPEICVRMIIRFEDFRVCCRKFNFLSEIYGASLN